MACPSGRPRNGLVGLRQDGAGKASEPSSVNDTVPNHARIESVAQKRTSELCSSLGALPGLESAANLGSGFGRMPSTACCPQSRCQWSQVPSALESTLMLNSTPPRSPLSSFAPYRRRQALTQIAEELNRACPAVGAGGLVDWQDLSAAVERLSSSPDPMIVFEQLANLLVPA